MTEHLGDAASGWVGNEYVQLPPDAPQSIEEFVALGNRLERERIEREQAQRREWSDRQHAWREQQRREADERRARAERGRGFVYDETVYFPCPQSLRALSDIFGSDVLSNVYRAEGHGPVEAVTGEVSMDGDPIVLELKSGRWVRLRSSEWAAFDVLRV